MKILVISDSHGNIANIKHVMGFAKKINAGTVIHCGDWNNIAAAETVLSYGVPLYSVLGNADIDPELEKYLSRQSKKFTHKFLEVDIDGKRIGIIHNIRNLGRDYSKLDTLFFGHWQKQADIIWKNIRAVNPGALENDINFGVYDTKTDKVELIHE